MYYLCLSVCALSLFTNIQIIASSTTYSCDRNSSCGCSTTQTIVSARIVGGELAPNHAWGWAVALYWNEVFICTGSLLDDRFALTAAHCVDGYENNPSLFMVLVGTNYLNGTGGQLRTVTKVSKHPNYDHDTYDNDIAILEFAALTSSSNLAYICLPAANVNPFSVGNDLVAVGWGVLASGSTDASNALRQVTVQAVSSNAYSCARMGVTSNQFCAGVPGGGKDTCQGDSGGPLMAFSNNQWVLAGITSSGHECALAGYSGVYTRVSKFIPYIYSIYDVTNSKTSSTPTLTLESTSTSDFASVPTSKSTSTSTFESASVSTSTSLSKFPQNRGNSMGRQTRAIVFFFIVFLIFQ